MYTHTIGKSPNQRTEKLSFVSEGFFLLRAQYDKEKKTIEEKRIQEIASCGEGNLTHSYRTTKDKSLDPKSSCHTYNKETAVETTFRGFCTL